MDALAAILLARLLQLARDAAVGVADGAHTVTLEGVAETGEDDRHVPGDLLLLGGGGRREARLNLRQSRRRRVRGSTASRDQHDPAEQHRSLPNSTHRFL